ncbi:hypothetical protein CL634_06440 [bacterium]|nr:hypothetical protein [bacterium]
MAGKGDKSRSCFSKRFRDNYDEINWGRKKTRRNCKRNPRRVLGDESGVREQQEDRGGNHCKRSCKCGKKS